VLRGVTSRPHDALFKAAFGSAEGAAGLLRAVLPTELVAAIEWSTLVVEGASFIDEDLADLYSDVLFSARLRGTSSVMIYVLVEHQSANHPSMPLRMLGYLVRVWERFLGQQQRPVPLPAIVPVLISHVPGGWTAPTAFDAMFAPDPVTIGAAPFVPRFELCVLDLAHRTDEEIRTWTLGTFQKLALAMLRDARDHTRLPETLAAWGDHLHDLHEVALRAPTGMRAFAQLLRYIWRVTGHVRFRAFRDTLLQQLPAARETVMTIYEEIVNEGRKEGRQEGRKEGLEESVRKLMTLKFGPLDPVLDARIGSASAEDLDRFLSRILTADSPAAVVDSEGDSSPTQDRTA